MKYYKISPWNFTIEEVEITRTSEQSVFYLDSRGKERRASNHLYFPTKEAAKQKLIDREEDDLKLAEQRLEYAKKELAEAKAIVI